LDGSDEVTDAAVTVAQSQGYVGVRVVWPGGEGKFVAGVEQAQIERGATDERRRRLVEYLAEGVVGGGNSAVGRDDDHADRAVAKDAGK